MEEEGIKGQQDFKYKMQGCKISYVGYEALMSKNKKGKEKSIMIKLDEKQKFILQAKRDEVSERLWNFSLVMKSILMEWKSPKDDNLKTADPEDILFIGMEWILGPNFSAQVPQDAFITCTNLLFDVIYHIAIFNSISSILEGEKDITLPDEGKWLELAKEKGLYVDLLAPEDDKKH